MLNQAKTTMIQKIINKLNPQRSEPKVSKVSYQVRKKGITYLSWEKIFNIEECLKNIQSNSVEGIFLEAGIALGGSAIIIASLMPKNRCFHGYDVFEMIPPPSDEDDDKSKNRYEKIKTGQSKGINGKGVYYGYIENLYEYVVKNFQKFHLSVDNQKIFLHQGLFENTLHFTESDKIAFAHIDCDWYEPVKLCLQKIYPILSHQGCIVVDDYYDYGGCKKAVDEFFSNYHDLVIVKNQGNFIMQRQVC
jgi:O-methyltransferase